MQEYRCILSSSDLNKYFGTLNALMMRLFCNISDIDMTYQPVVFYDPYRSKQGESVLFHQTLVFYSVCHVLNACYQHQFAGMQLTMV